MKYVPLVKAVNPLSKDLPSVTLIRNLKIYPPSFLKERKSNCIKISLADKKYVGQTLVVKILVKETD